MILQKDTKAPDFQLLNPDGKPVALKDYYQKKNVILIFYPADWSPVCGDEIALFSEMKSIFDKEEAVLLGISVDSFFCHKAFTDDRKVHFQLLADFEPKGDVAKKYGVYNDQAGYDSRALFLIDKQGQIAWSFLSPDEINPGADGVLDALEKLKS
ncbi:redoxin domain-containing protein [Pedobacter sp. MC2016-24]|uniref:redoxin domain-containing protein n=1 Tax=Pedobacter sp. MC2016-24 TaxID=2780090 RepID=UPI001D1676E1|nr:redoxin domain-containing protein [Pedobacter sp. MC2016-24]